MWKYVGKKLLAAVITIYLLATVTFVAMHLVPGDPLLGNKASTPEIRANLERFYGLDRPVAVQYLIYLKNIVHGDLGISFTQPNRSVNDIIRDAFPVSAALGVVALLFAALGGIFLGAVTAQFRGRPLDRITMAIVILAISVPNFVLAATSQYLVTELNKRVGMEVLPVGGWGTFAHLILPSVVLGLGTLAFLTRLERSSLVEVVYQDYIRTAKAKGLPALRIFFVHQLRNAVLPVITILGPAIAAITTGGFVVETVFAIPGLGRYFVQAVQQLDYTVILGTTVFYGGFLVLMSMTVDIIYGLIDPRISVGKKS